MKKIVKQLIADQDQIQVKLFFDTDSGQATLNIVDIETNTLQYCKVYPKGLISKALIHYLTCRQSFK